MNRVGSMKTEHCRAIVLSRCNYGENDLVVSLFTLEHGRLRGFAKSARSSRKRFAGLLEPTNQLELLIVLKEEGLSRVERVENTACYTKLREQLESLALAIYACELVEMLTPEGQKLPRLFRLLTVMMEQLSSAGFKQSYRRFFEINLLNILGYRPVITEPLLKPLTDCMRTSNFDKVQFSDLELKAAGIFLDKEITVHCPYQLKSMTFLEELL